MFEKSAAELEELGAYATTSEIIQQPDIWLDTFDVYAQHAEEVRAFLESARPAEGGRVTVVFTGAGSSEYVGNTCSPYLRSVVRGHGFDFKPVASTDLVSAPTQFLSPDDPTVLVSFARSGNSPESLAAIEVVRTVCTSVKFLNITCAPDGRLATEMQNDPDALTLLLPKANDDGFAMTGSYSCMYLLATLLFDPSDDDSKRAWVEAASRLGRDVLRREEQVSSYVEGDFSRVTYLGSGALGGLAQEAQLKILELAAGETATSFGTSMGYRHGPKSFVDASTLVFLFVSNDHYTRQYDLDMLNEIKADGICKRVVAIEQDTGELFGGTSFDLSGEEALPDGYLVLPFVIFGQTIALHNSIRVDDTPDTPSPTGQVTRVVHGVTIHPFVV
ncbi:SIS domain-containing protein [Olsenella uli]|uniref:SIS domain-containing protein n=1 Tax=Olsenella uli TaxID=133926 RepID=UPI0012AB98CC|nr:SIS domain-containing protein [Olsenella uli]